MRSAPRALLTLQSICQLGDNAQMPVGLFECLVNDTAFSPARNRDAQQIRQRGRHVRLSNLALQVEAAVYAGPIQHECRVLGSNSQAAAWELVAMSSVELRA